MSLLGLLVFTACSLEEKDFTEVEKGKFMRNAKEAETVLSSFAVVHAAH